MTVIEIGAEYWQHTPHGLRRVRIDAIDGKRAIVWSYWSGKPAIVRISSLRGRVYLREEINA